MVNTVLLTGGPGAGKTTALKYILDRREDFARNNINLIPISETATRLIEFHGCRMNSLKEFQTAVLTQQMNLEKIIKSACNNPNNKMDTLILCDRGTLDGFCFCPTDMFLSILSTAGISDRELLNGYDYIFHLISPARECPEFYTLSTNKSRIETVDEAKEADFINERIYGKHSNYIQIHNDLGVPGKYERLYQMLLNINKEK